MCMLISLHSFVDVIIAYINKIFLVLFALKLVTCLIMSYVHVLALKLCSTLI